MIRARLQGALGSERGFSVVELVVATLIGSLVMLAAFNILDRLAGHANATDDRTEAVQRGRNAMNEIAAQLRSQVCMPPDNTAIVAGTGDSVTFYVNMTEGGTGLPEKRTLTYDPSTKTLTEYAYVPSGTPPNLVFPGTPTRTRVLVSNVGPVSGVPFFRYYAYTSTGQITPTVLLSTPLTDADRTKVVNVGVSFVALPTRGSTTVRTTTFQTDVFVAGSDPTSPTRGPTCF